MSLRTSLAKLTIFCSLFAPISLITGQLTPCHAGVTLDGVPVSQYEAYGTQSQFAASGALTFPGASIASGILISPEYVLTAAHVGAGRSFVFGGTTYTTTEFIRHPQYVLNGNRPDSLAYGFDVAVYRLSTPVTNVAPARVYTGSSEVALTGSVTGFGLTGVGSVANPALGTDGVFRAGTNVLDQIASFANGPNGEVGAQNALILSDFDAPAGFGSPGQFNSLGSASPTSLEYHVANGDSGGGLFIQENGQWYLAGVNSFAISQRDLLDPTNPLLNNQLFGYGAVSGFTRLSSFQSFLAPYIGVPEPTSIALCSIGIGGIMSLRRWRKNRTAV